VKGLSFGAITAAISVVASIAIGAEGEAPAWKKPAAGPHAFLGDDGGGVDTATVCGTLDHYRDWLRLEHPSDCQTFQHGLPVVIEVVTHDPVTDAVGDYYQPIAKILIPSRNFTGYVQLLGLHPDIPKGTIVHYKRNRGFNGLLLYPAAKSSSKDGALDLGEQATAKVISYDPTNYDNWELHLEIIDGPRAGATGWMPAFGAVGDDDIFIDQFEGAQIRIR
jgi:hypothetical protein